MEDLSRRSPAEVFEDHLRLSIAGTVDEDVKRNYAPDCVMLTGRGTFRGHDGMKKLAAMLRKELPHPRFNYVTKTVDGRVAFLEWTGSGEGAWVGDGADSYVIENGKITAQTIHYTVRPQDGHEGGDPVEK